MKRLTIKDLAQMMNLSTSTVSRALSDHPDISDSTKKRVKEVAEELNYTANMHARLFRKQNSGLIALVLPEVNMFYTPNLIRGINKTIATSNYSLITFLSNDSYKREKEIIKQCLQWAVEGVMISLSTQTYDLQHLEPLKKSKIQCLLLDKAVSNKDFPSVIIDSVEASYNAVRYLIDYGHTNILGIFGNPSLDISKQRLEGYRKALNEAGLPIVDENIVFVDSAENLDFILPPIFNHNRAITALFTMSDELLAKSLYHINKRSIRIPEDLSVITISDGAYPLLVHPKISHIKDSGSKLGKQASKYLLDAINESQDAINKTKIIATKIVELESVVRFDECD